MAEEPAEDLSAARLIDTLCDEFEEALAAGQSPAIEAFLPRVPPESRLMLLTELLGLTVDFRIARGQQPVVGDYAGRFPELSADQLGGILHSSSVSANATSAQPDRCPESSELRQASMVNGMMGSPPSPPEAAADHEYSSTATILAEAVKLPSPDTRQAFIAKVCFGDPTRLREMERLLDWYLKAAGNAFKEPTPVLPVITEGPGTQIGPYKLREQIGEGGMGIVYVADQSVPIRRRVALKIIKPGMDSRQVIARFEAERQALAMMDHPHIARILDAGATDSGRPYFVMELVKGIPITEFCDLHRYTIRQRLEIFIRVCQAVQHAHQKGIIHRDLKPSNIMVEMYDVLPSPKVIDFGIAKATGQSLSDETVYTQYAQLIGTPLYMSPEQAQLSALDVDTRSDVYSLGVLLYELLTGSTPFDSTTLSKGGVDEMRRIIREVEPPRPSQKVSTLHAELLSTISDRRQTDARTLSVAMRRELDWVVMKTLEKDRDHRYESAGALAADLERYLGDEPVQACPPSTWYRLRKFARRRRGTLISMVLIVSALVVGTAAATWQAMLASAAAARMQQAEADTHQEAERNKDLSYAAEIRLASQLQQSGANDQARLLLERWIPKAGERDRRGLGYRLLDRQSHIPGQELLRLPDDVSSLRMAPDRRYLVAATDGGTVRRFGLQTHRELPPWETGLTDVRRITFSPDGLLLALISYEAEVAVIETATGQLRRRLPGPTPSAGSADVEFLDDSTLIATGCGPVARVWNVVDGSLRCDWKIDDRMIHDCAVTRRLDGVLFLSSGNDGDSLRFFKEPGEAEHQVDLLLPETAGSYSALALSPNGHFAAVGKTSGEVQVWDWRHRHRMARVTLPQKINELTFSSDSRALAIAEKTGNIHVWRWQDHAEPMNEFRGKARQVTADDSGIVTLWPADQPRVSVSPEFRVNTHTRDSQWTTNRSAAMDAEGNFVVVWTSNDQDSSSAGVYVQLFEASGKPRGVEFRANRTFLRDQLSPVVARNACGEFVIVWSSDRQDGNETGVYARSYDADGSPREPREFLVNTKQTHGAQQHLALAMNATGDFLVVWSTPSRAGAGWDLFAQRYWAGAIADGDPFLVNPNQPSTQPINSAAAGLDDDGNCVIAWSSLRPEGKAGDISIQRFSSSGIPAASPLPIDEQFIAGKLGQPSLAMNSRGDFVLAWLNVAEDRTAGDIFAQRFDSGGAAQGRPICVTASHPTRACNAPSVAIDADAGFIVTWASSRGTEGDEWGVYAQQFNPDGTRQGSEFLVNNHMIEIQYAPAIAMNGGGDYVIAWTSREDNASRFDVYARQPARDAELLRQLQIAGTEQLDIHLVEDQGGRITVEIVNNPAVDPELRLEESATVRGRESLVHWSAHLGPARSVIFASDERRVISAGSDGRILLWAWGHSGGLGIPGMMNAIAWVSSRKAVAFSSATELELFDRQTAEPRRRIRTSTGSSGDLIASDPDGRWLARACRNGPILCWDPSQDSEPFPLPESSQGDGYRLLEFLPEPHCLTGLSTKTLRWSLWDLDKRKLLRTQDLSSFLIRSATLSRKGSRLVILTADALVSIDVASGVEQSRVTLDGRLLQGGRTMAASPEGNLLAIGCEQQILLVEAPTGVVRQVLVGHSGVIQQLHFTPDGSTLLALDNHGNLKLWQVAHGMELLTLPKSGIRTFDLSPDGHWLALIYDQFSEVIEVGPLGIVE